MDTERLMKTKKQEVLEAIEKIHFEHRHDAGAMFGTLTPDEAERDYRALSNSLDIMPGLTAEDIDELRQEIENRIQNIPQVEAEKEAEYQKDEQRKARAFENAKARYRQLSFFEKQKLKLEGKDPDSLDIEYMYPEHLDALYRDSDGR